MIGSYSGDLEGDKKRQEELNVLRLDLAQLHTRLADIQKSNGNYLASIDDYQSSLDLRLVCLGKYHRKVADCFMSLAGGYLSLAMIEDDECEGENDVEEGDDELPPPPKKLTDEEKVAYRMLSVKHYLNCGMCFAGMNAEALGKDPTFKHILEKKATEGDDDDDDEVSNVNDVSIPSTPSEIMNALKKEIMSYSLFQQTPPRPTNETKVEAWKAEKQAIEASWNDEQDTFMFNFEMVDELLENIDASEENVQGLIQISGLASGVADAENSRKDNGDSKDGKESIGFGNSGTSLPAPPPQVVSGTVNLAPMMVIKKKKKPEAASSPNKKLKVEEGVVSEGF